MTEQLPNVSLPVPQVTPDELPKEFGGGGGAPPAPGTYVFQLPANFARHADAIRDFEVRVDQQGFVINKTIPNNSGGRSPNPEYEKGIKSARRMFLFNDSHPLVVQGAPQIHAEEIGKTVFASVSGMERNMARKGQTPVPVAPTTYLLKALGAQNIYPSSTSELVEFLAVFANATFKADLEWRGNCRDDKPARVLVTDAADNESVEDRKDPQTGNPVNGCGRTVYMRDWPKDPKTGKYFSRIGCACGALLYPMAEIRNFKPAG